MKHSRGNVNLISAHFHLRNGASLFRINYMGNTNKYGLNLSHGIMVNYRYNLSEIEVNNNDYVMHGKIAASDQVVKWLSDSKK